MLYIYMSMNLCLSNSLKLKHLLLLYFCIIQLIINAQGNMTVLSLQIQRRRVWKKISHLDQITVCDLQNNKMYKDFMDILYLNTLKTIIMAALLWYVKANTCIVLPASMLVTKVCVSIFVMFLYTDHKNLLWPLAKRSFSSWAFFRITFFCASSNLLVCRSTLRSNGRLSLCLPSSFSFCKFKRKIVTCEIWASHGVKFKVHRDVSSHILVDK